VDNTKLKNLLKKDLRPMAMDVHLDLPPIEAFD